MKTKTYQDGVKEFGVMKDSEKVDVLISALTIMQSNNRHSMIDAIMYALGYEPVNGSPYKTWKRKTPQSC